jgi:hypothetical protein
LDNLRGQCGDIIGWGCDSDGTNAYTSFWISHASGDCVQNAIWLSQNHLSGVTCYEV